MKKLGLALLATAAVSTAVGCAAPAPTTKGEAKGETGSYLLAGTVLTAAQVADYVRQAGFPENMVGKMVCTAKYESSFYEKASNGSHYGLFQIAKSHLGENGCASTVAAIYEPANNAACAFAVYQAQGLGAWEAYTSHKSTCDAYRAPGSATASNDETTDTNGDGVVDGNDGTTQVADNGMVGGGCYSSTGGSMVSELACIETSQYGWVQCHEGQWYQGDDGSQGPFGSCSSTGGSDGNDQVADNGSEGSSDDGTGFASVKPTL